MGACVEVFCDDNNEFKGLFFQDKEMMSIFEAYPEMIFIDATYKLLQIGVPVFLILCEDANGQSEIAAVCLLVTKDGESLKWMIKAFKKLNSKWCDIRTVMADKDLNERDAVKESLPQATMLICMFDTLRTFRREIT